ncbi:MAG: DUF1648 domain-containing protein [Planctomycetota bacterium]
MLRIFNLLLLIAAAALCVSQFMVWYPQLPEVLPSHFDQMGEVDGTMKKGPYFLLMGSMQTLFLLGFPLLGKLLGRLPESMINIPNKEYWLDESRKAESLDSMFQLLVLFAWLTSLLLTTLVQISSWVAIGQIQNIQNYFLVALGVYLAVTVAVLVWIILKFRMPKRNLETSG